MADAPAGVAWLTRAAQGGLPQAQNNLAALFEQGAGGVPQNLSNAGQLYSLAANQGHAAATLALARLYSKGIGTAADLPKAWALATLAAERGEDNAKKFASDLVEKLDEKQRAEGIKDLEAIKSGKATAPTSEDAKSEKPASPKPADTKPATTPKPPKNPK